MRILVVGSGGREHAMVRMLLKSPQVKKIWCAPGNAGIAQDAECISIKADDVQKLYTFAKDQKVDLTMVGPEAPLVAGLVDHFRRGGLRIVGPNRTAAKLEGSKSFAKDFMKKYGIPTARYEVVPNLRKGSYLLQHWPARSVVKADGLAAGKGVKVCETQAEAKAFLYELMENEIFGSAGSTAIIEECLEGQEVTIMAFCDGKTLIPMPASQDHKRLLDNDQGPNTGGMGAYAPTPILTPPLQAEIEERIFKPFLKGVVLEKFDFRGIIYFGLMITDKGPFVLEFNVRFGDPETQVVLPLLDTDFVNVLMAVADQKLTSTEVRWKKQSAMCVVLAAEGYPGKPKSGQVIEGLPKSKEVHVFHAGTRSDKNQIVTAGGRVLGITAVASTLEAARNQAYDMVKKIHFDGMQYRQDIGAKALSSRTVSRV